jgi:DNA-binding response OmpR family regulator
MNTVKEALQNIFGTPPQIACAQETKTDQESPAKDGIVVLLIEDNPGDAKLTSMMLSKAEGTVFRLDTCNQLTTGLDRLSQGGVDALLLDLSLPDSHGIETFKRVRSVWPKLPIIVLSSDDDEKNAIRAVKLGAQDYLIKGRVDENSLGRAIQFAMGRQERINTLTNPRSSPKEN